MANTRHLGIVPDLHFGTRPSEAQLGYFERRGANPEYASKAAVKLAAMVKVMDPKTLTKCSCPKQPEMFEQHSTVIYNTGECNDELKYAHRAKHWLRDLSNNQNPRLSVKLL
ncbi:hypothetical protein KCP78_03295 [Salmonella enterica subsp. enterica]|nr:hypothetical protein KCP78_03295 [Salmonella enterica subsp. enterica]